MTKAIAPSLSDNEKIALYKADRYSFPPPPVCTRLWGIADWIKYIDLHGVWYPVELTLAKVNT